MRDGVGLLETGDLDGVRDNDSEGVREGVTCGETLGDLEREVEGDLEGVGEGLTGLREGDGLTGDGVTDGVTEGLTGEGVTEGVLEGLTGLPLGLMEGEEEEPAGEDGETLASCTGSEQKQRKAVNIGTPYHSQRKRDTRTGLGEGAPANTDTLAANPSAAVVASLLKPISIS